VYPGLERVINNRQWQRRCAPFPHFVAVQVFKPWFYERLECTFNQLLSSDDTEHDGADSKKGISQSVGGKRWLWEIFCLVIAVYTMAVVFGLVDPVNRLSSSEILLVAIVAIGTLLKISPQWLDKLAKVKVGILELELNKVQRDVKRVGGELEHLRLMLAVTLPQLSQDLLTNALVSKAFVPVDESVKKSLRRLTEQKLFVRKPSGIKGVDKKIGEIAPGESFLDTLALTEQGKRVAELIQRIGRTEDTKGE